MEEFHSERTPGCNELFQPWSVHLIKDPLIHILSRTQENIFFQQFVFLGVENLIGKGGYAEVYRGFLKNGQVVAIKRLTRGNFDENIGDFLLELGIMAHINHPNTAKLIGYGIEGGMHLVLEFFPHGSLASTLHG